jgi:hypothetical protein
MTKRLIINSTTLSILFMLFCSHGMYSQVTVSGPYQGPPGFANGMNSTMHCGNSPESWVRGSATFDKNSGALTITIQLETDAVHAGPKGKVTVYLQDCNNKRIAEATTDEVGRGGKSPGKAEHSNYTSTKTIDSDLAKKVCSLYVVAQCTGSVDRIFNIKLGTATDAFGILVKGL